MIYPLLKSLHVLFVIAWMAAVFYLPRILVNLAEAKARGEGGAVLARLSLMGRRLYRFGHSMFGCGFLAGLLLWQGWRWWPADLPNAAIGQGWLHAKLGLVALLLVYYIVCGRWLKRGSDRLPAARRLRWFNELPVLLLLGVLYLVMARPF